MIRGLRGPLTSSEDTQDELRGYRMDKIAVFARCGNTKLYFVCPVTRVIKRLYRVRHRGTAAAG